MAPRATIPVLVAGMLVTGIGNSIFSKWQDMQCVAHCAPGDEARRVDFSQPVWQTAQMFLGECLCLIPPMMMALWAWITRPRPGFFKGGGSGGEYEALGQSPAMANDLEGLDDEPGDSGFSALGADDDPHANSSAFSFLMPSHWLGEEGSSSAFSRLVPAFWPVWKAPTPAPTLGRSASFRPGQGNANNVWGERVPANATASARAPPAGGEGQAAAVIPEPHQIVDEPEEDDGTKLKGKAIFLFLMPAACDICGTTLMNVGLLFTPVSIYQMTRGALVLWVGVFSVIFLQRQLFLFQWLSLLTVMLGVCIVGLSGTLLQPGAPASLQGTFVTIGGAIVRRATAHAAGEDVPDTAKAFIGVLLILFAQLFTAGQFVLEEKIMSCYSVEPLLAVGYEGLFGFIATLAAQVTLHHFYGKTPAGRGGYFDMVTGWEQMVQSRNVLLGGVAICLSIALFNFFGLSVTRTVSATARSTIDTCRTLGIWAVSLVLGWEVFRPLTGSLQLLGFALLCGATLLFNGVIGPRYLPRWLRPGRPALARLRSRSRSRLLHRSRSRSRVPSAYNPLPTDEEEVRRFSTDQN